MADYFFYLQYRCGEPGGGIHDGEDPRLGALGIALCFWRKTQTLRPRKICAIRALQAVSLSSILRCESSTCLVPALNNSRNA